MYEFVPLRAVDILNERLLELEPGTPEAAYDLMMDFMRAGQYDSDIGGILYMSVMAGGEESLKKWQRLISSTIVWPGVLLQDSKPTIGRTRYAFD